MQSGNEKLSCHLSRICSLGMKVYYVIYPACAIGFVSKAGKEDLWRLGKMHFEKLLVLLYKAFHVRLYKTHGVSRVTLQSVLCHVCTGPGKTHGVSEDGKQLLLFRRCKEEIYGQWLCPVWVYQSPQWDMRRLRGYVLRLFALVYPVPEEGTCGNWGGVLSVIFWELARIAGLLTHVNRIIYMTSLLLTCSSDDP